jgi:uncharacterized protein (TIGR03437 family)
MQGSDPQSQSPAYQCDASGCVAIPIDLSAGTPVYLSLYGTGIRNLSSLANVSVSINGDSLPVLFAGPQPQSAGLDRVDVLLDPNLSGSGASNVILTVDGQTANVVTVYIQ